MSEDYSAQLASVRAAIAVIEAGAQSYVMGRKTVTRANLSTLYQREERLMRIIKSQSSGDSMTDIGVYGGME